MSEIAALAVANTLPQSALPIIQSVAAPQTQENSSEAKEPQNHHN
ncbi:MAG: hypothetical protein AB7P17_09820 [Nitrospirales bacterium]